MASLRQGVRDHREDPGFWVKWRDWKFYGDANVVYVEGHDEDYFVLPSTIQIMHSYPQGVRADCENGRSYLIHEDCFGPELSGMVITELDEQTIRVLDNLIEEIHGKENSAV